MIIYVKIDVMVLSQRDASVLRAPRTSACSKDCGPRPRTRRRRHRGVLANRVSRPGAALTGTYRSTLRRLGGAARSTSAFCASPAPPPYDRAEIAALWSMATHQSSALRVANATVLVATTLGAGLRARELAHLRALDVGRRHDETTVIVSGHHPRAVPVLAPTTRRSGDSPASDAGGSFARVRRCATPKTSSARSQRRSRVTPTRWDSRAPGPGHVHLSPPRVAHRARRTLHDRGTGRRRVAASLRAPRRGCAHVQGDAARRSRHLASGNVVKRRRTMIADEEVTNCLRVIERSGVAEWLEEELRQRRRRPGRPRMLSVRALLGALLLLATDDRALRMTGVTEVLFCRLSDESRATLGVRGDAHDARSFAARYRQVGYLFHALSAVLDPSGLVKNRRLCTDEFLRRCVTLSDEEERSARGRLESFMGQLLRASVDECALPRPALAYGLDATPVALFSRGPSKRSGLCASDPDGGWYVREGDHREREDHRGRTRSRVAWALEATLLTTASPTPGALGSFPNLVVGLALDRPGIDPGGTAVRVLRGARARGFTPGPLGVDRAYSGYLARRSTCRRAHSASISWWTTASTSSVARPTATARCWSRAPGTARRCPRRWSAPPRTCALRALTRTPTRGVSRRGATTRCGASPVPTPTATSVSCVPRKVNIPGCAANYDQRHS